MDTKQSPTNLGLSFGVVNCLVVFPTHFNLTNSLLTSLQISLLFMCTPALNEVNFFLIQKILKYEYIKNITPTAEVNIGLPRIFILIKLDVSYADQRNIHFQK